MTGQTKSPTRAVLPTSTAQTNSRNTSTKRPLCPTPPGHYGNTGRDILSGPGLDNVNLSLVRSFPPGERFGTLEFRSEFFNLFNHPNFGQPDGNLSDKTFAVISTTGPAGIADPRILQFALRYRY